MRPMSNRTSGSDLRPIGDVVEEWLATLVGPTRLAAFYEMPLAMQRGAWEGLRREVEHEREAAQAWTG